MIVALMGSGPRGAPGTPLWIGAAAVALFFWLSLTGGAFYFPGGRVIARRSAPRRYWALMSLLGALFVALVVFGVRAFMLDTGSLE